MITDLEKDAQQIAAHIVNDDMNIAKDMFDRKVDGLKHFEAVILRDKIHEAVKEIEARMVK